MRTSFHQTTMIRSEHTRTPRTCWGAECCWCFSSFSPTTLSVLWSVYVVRLPPLCLIPSSVTNHTENKHVAFTKDSRSFVNTQFCVSVEKTVFMSVTFSDKSCCMLNSQQVVWQHLVSNELLVYIQNNQCSARMKNILFVCLEEFSCTLRKRL